VLQVNPVSEKDVVLTPLAIWLLLEGVNPDAVLRNTL
jgi:hypothetical protein